TLWLSYAQNRAAIEAGLAQDLRTQSGQAAREMGVWLRERLYDLRVFASSYEVSDTITPTSRSTGPAAATRLHEYLNSLHERFTDYDRLLVLDLDGNVEATSDKERGSVRLPTDWLKTLRAERQVVGQPTWDGR